MKKGLWTISELGTRVSGALSRDYDGPEKGQVQAIPSERTIRYYTTLGLIDRPTAMDGRRALYGRRHLLQLVAIKRLQAEGLSLARIQERLTGLSDAALADIARLPVEEPAEPGSEEPVRTEGDRFWAAAPPPPPKTPEKQSPEATDAEPERLEALRFGSAITLLLDLERPLTTDDQDAIQKILAPLDECLRERGLLPPNERKET